MRYYPVHLDLRGRRCLVVGGGGVGQRKAEGLVRCGADVVVVCPEATEELVRMGEDGRIALHRRGVEEDDLEGAFLVFCATADAALNRRLAVAARSRGILVSVADLPEGSDFVLPSVVERGDLVLTVSTSGRSPAFAKTLRKRLERQFGTEYDTFLRLMGAVRNRVLARGHAPEDHRALFHGLIEGGLLEAIREGDAAGVDALLAAALGERVDHRTLLGEPNP
jgi:precorrin-2 dehydrogenase/sirohydrochlorin ferrochelatase